MENLTRLPLSHRISTKFFLLGCACVILLLAGHWIIYSVARQMLHSEAMARGEAITRQLAKHAEEQSRLNHPVEVTTISDNILHKEGVRYVVVTDENDRLISSSKHQSIQRTTFSKKFYASACKSDHAIIRKFAFANESVYDIGIRILRPSETSKATQQSDCAGTIHLGFSLQAVELRQSRLRFFSIGLSVFTILIGLGVMAYVSWAFFTPLQKITSSAEDLSRSYGHQSFDGNARHELDVLQSALSHISNLLSTYIKRLKGGCNHVASNSDSLLAMLNQQTSCVENQEQLLTHMAGDTDMLTEASQHVSIHLQQVLAHIDSSHQSTHQMQTMIHNVIEAIEDIREQVVNNTERVVVLGEKIAQIRNVVKIITTIADQTKIIAINASIEAAGAGETGGRFSVVATEVRRLANTVVESVEEIKESISSIQTATSELILSSETGIRKVEQGALLIAETDETLHTIMATLEETTHSTDDISRSSQQQQNELQRLSDGLIQLSSLTEQSKETCQHADDIVRELRSLAEELDETIQKVVT